MSKNIEHYQNLLHNQHEVEEIDIKGDKNFNQFELISLFNNVIWETNLQSINLKLGRLFSFVIENLAKHIAENQDWKSLKTLDLSNNNISDLDACTFVMALEKNKTLINLDLSGNPEIKQPTLDKIDLLLERNKNIAILSTANEQSEEASKAKEFLMNKGFYDQNGLPINRDVSGKERKKNSENSLSTPIRTPSTKPTNTKGSSLANGTTTTKTPGNDACIIL